MDSICSSYALRAYPVHLTLVTRWDLLSLGVWLYCKRFSCLVSFRVFITVSVVIFIVRVLLITLWYVCHLPGIGLLLGLTYD